MKCRVNTMGEPGRTLCSRAITYASSTWTWVWASYTIRPPDTSTMRTLGDHATVHPCPMWVHVEARGRPLSAVFWRPTHSPWPSMTRKSWASTERYVYSHVYVIWASTIRCTWPHPPQRTMESHAHFTHAHMRSLVDSHVIAFWTSMSPFWASTRFLGGHMISWMPTKCCGLPRMLWASTKLVGDHEKSWASTLCIVVIQSCPLTSNMSLHTHPVATTSVQDMRPVSSIYVHVSRPSVSMMPPATPTLIHVSCPHTSSIRPRSPTSHAQIRPVTSTMPAHTRPCQPRG